MYGNRDGGFQPRGMGGGFAPVKMGEELDVKIEAVGEKGDGIARKKGFVLFVPNTKEGQEVRIRITKVLRKVGFAEAIGPAQGPINDEPVAPRERSPRREEQHMPQPEPEPAPEDSEDFGEEYLEPEEKEEELEAPKKQEEIEAPEDKPELEGPEDELEVPPPPDSPEGEVPEKEE